MEVENNSYWDVRVYQDNPRQRLGFVGGHTTVALKACQLEGRPPHFEVRAMGNAFTLTLRGTGSYVEAGQRIGIVVGATPNMSHVIGEE